MSVFVAGPGDEQNDAFIGIDPTQVAQEGQRRNAERRTPGLSLFERLVQIVLPVGDRRITKRRA